MISILMFAGLHVDHWGSLGISENQCYHCVFVELKSLTSVQTSKSISRQVIAVSMAPLRNRCIANELDEIAPNSTDEGGPSYSDTTAQGRYRSPWTVSQNVQISVKINSIPASSMPCAIIGSSWHSFFRINIPRIGCLISFQGLFSPLVLGWTLHVDASTIVRW